MAIGVEFEGWVNETKTFSWGTILKVTHDQRAKNDATGEWETVGKDYIDVVVTDELLAKVGDAKLVSVKGTAKIETYTKKDGTTGAGIKVRAKDINPVERGARRDPVEVVREVLAPATYEDTEIPF